MTQAALLQEQRRALEELKTLAQASDTLQVGASIADGSDLVVALDLNTQSFTSVPGGLPIRSTERIYVRIPGSFPWRPPGVEVDHHRWDGQPHVLQGRRLCLYLDPMTEWNPTTGMAGFLERLWNWFDDAIAGRFDPATALYHAVGGVLHRTAGTPTIVVADPIDQTPGTFAVRSMTLRQRGVDRVDVVAWDRVAPSPDHFRGVAVILPDPLPRGGGFRLSDIAIAIRAQTSRHQRKQFLRALQEAAASLKGDQHVYVVLAVPNQNLVGDARLHLIGCRLAKPLVMPAVDAAGRRHALDAPHGEEPPVEWTYVDDTRAAIVTRRDSQRPVSALAGKTVELWGCGAIGSWIGEFLVRAGVSRIIVRDPGYVIHGLLVRQNYREEDVGRRKVDALADRLRAVSDTVTVEPCFGLAELALPIEGHIDLIFDATVNTSVAVALARAQAAGQCKTPVAQVATDTGTATLGILTITRGDQREETNSLDQALMAAALSDPALTPFREFWQAGNHPPLTPTLGCSVPTFHGSAADAATIAATAVNLVALAMQRHVACGYLFGSPTTPHPVPPCTHVTPNST
jgi:Dinucleotide-utilizing enzymes involved in molybdopterin and thiamine biosynthesis family 2